MFPRRLTSFRRLAHRAVSWTLFATYTATALGLAIPVPIAVDPTAAPFPCQGKRCGCRTAEQCWTACCCSSPRERVAWAERNGVRPPRELAILAARETTPVAVRDCCAAKRACCANTPAATRSPGATAPTARSTSKNSRIVWISPLDVRGCRGEAPVWMSVPISLPSTGLQRLPAFEACVRPLAPLAAAVPACPSFTPPEPPPRLG